MSVTGFSSERTSEYMILNNLYNKVQSKCQLFYPFYYHKKRDDTQLSLLNDPCELQVVACFARRPKTDSVLSRRTIITFRNSIFEQANFLRKLSITVICGSPIGTGIENIGFGAECKWFYIKTGIEESYIEYSFLDHNIDPMCQVEGVQLLDDTQLYKVLRSATKYHWTELIEVIRTWNRAYSDYYFSHHSRNLFNTYSGCKPVFIAYHLID